MGERRHIGMIAHVGALGAIAALPQAYAEEDDLTVEIQEADPEVLRLIDRLENALIDEKPTRQERRQWNKPAKKPKALRGRP
jgi:hypothetical protein